MHLSKDTFDFVVNHVILPPKLPQHEDEEEDEIKGEEQLLDFVYDSVVSFVFKCEPGVQKGWDAVIAMLRNLKNTRQQRSLCKDTLQNLLSDLGPCSEFATPCFVQSNLIPDAVALHVKAQNAGLVFQKSCDDRVIVDAFEASPQCESVIQAKDRLVRTFPGRSVSMPGSLFREFHFTQLLSVELQKLDLENVEICRPTTTKSRSIVPEMRETAHPGMVTEYIMSMFEALGHPHDGPTIQKKIRDEVNWSNSRLPWRRSPFWLFLRVSMQLLLAEAFSEDVGRLQYKNFMAFLLAHLCEAALHMNVRPDLQSIVNVKASRRLAKLGAGALGFVTNTVGEAVGNARLHLEKSWKKFQKSEKRTIPHLNSVATTEETVLPLRNSSAYLDKVLEADTCKTGQHVFRPTGGIHLEFRKNGLPITARLKDSPRKTFLLVDLEEWVLNQLHQWKKGRVAVDEDCVELMQIMRVYINVAERQYKRNSIALSIMLLVVMELWTVLDMIAVELYPLLANYPPEIPNGLMDPLLLPHEFQMKTLERIEHHISWRCKRADAEARGIFASLKGNSFSVRFFNQSSKHKDLRRRIEEDATNRRQQKREEWSKKSDQHRRLQQEISRLDHLRVSNKFGDMEHDKAKCQKCRLAGQANSIMIHADEWPLPTDDNQLKNTIFELDCPRGFSAWRDATWVLLQDLGRHETLSGEKLEQELLSYDLLKPYVSNHGQRLTLGSYTKSFLRAHYRLLHFPTSLERVLVNNGHQYRLLDRENTVWVKNQTYWPNLHRHCISHLPDGPYKNLQDFVDRSSHSPNDALARQQECNAQLSSHEFIAFATLRCGESIQWLNILRELGSADLNVNAQEVFILIRQAALQVGSGGNTHLREAHLIFGDIEFSSRLLHLLEHHLGAVEENWREQNRLSILVMLALRTISLSQDHATVDRAASLLRRVRKVSVSWCRRVSAKLPECSTEESSRKLRERITTAALTCRATFDVDFPRVAAILEDDEDIAMWVESSIHLHNNCPIWLDDLSHEMRHAVLIGERTSRRMERHVRPLIIRSSHGVSQAVEQICGLRNLTRNWEFLSGTKKIWAKTETVAGKGKVSQQIHYNLLTGELLVDGELLGRLPSAYTRTPLYRRIFSSRILNVATSDMSNMRYQALNEIDGHQIHFTMEGDELIIKAREGGRVLRLIPHTVFGDDLPAPLTEEYVHWIDMRTSVVEFRPFEDPFKKPKKTIQMKFSPPIGSYLMVGPAKLVCSTSHVGSSILQILSVLEMASYTILVASVNGTVEAQLPRYRLNFFVNGDGSLESKDFAAVVDKDQDIGCMFGLENKLVLRSVESHSAVSRRSVLVPYGTFNMQGNHYYRHVKVETGKDRNLRLLQYQLEPKLSKLRSGPGAVSKLYLALLHAVTGYALADPLTGHTGTQESLRILSEQSLRGTSPIARDEMDLLNRIAKLAPKREYYPRHLQRMQSVEWTSILCQLAQDEGFYFAVSGIVTYAARFAMLHEDGSADSGLVTRGEIHLIERAARRSSTVRAATYREKQHEDAPYSGRDRGARDKRACRVYQTVSLVAQWRPQADVLTDLPQVVRDWAKIGGYREPPDVLKMTCTEALQFSLGEGWGSLYTFCRNCKRETHAFQLMFLFSKIVFAQALSEPIVRTLLGIASSGKFKNLMPARNTYDLSRGEKPSYSQLRTTIERHCKDPRRELRETEEKWVKRREDELRQASHQVSYATDHLLGQWDCDSPTFPSAHLIDHIDASSASKPCATLFRTCNDNRKFMLHIKEVQKELSRIHSSQNELDLPILPLQRPLSLGAAPSAISPTLLELLRDRSVPRQRSLPPGIQYNRAETPTKPEIGRTELRGIIDNLRSIGNVTRKSYAEDLRSSLACLENTKTLESPQAIGGKQEHIVNHHSNLADFVEDSIREIGVVLRPEDECSETLLNAGLWPRITSASLLACLSNNSRDSLSAEWKKTLVLLGEATASLQRSERMLNAYHRDDVVGFYKEAENPGRVGWSAVDYPDWLLIEVENDLTIRHIQVSVALKMIFPDSAANSVLQLNMGEGKSSVIIPMILSALANRRQIPRLIVLKPLLRQTEYLLAQRLGGLVDRRIYHLPFSRKTCLDSNDVDALRSIYQECLEERGILITLPEHMMSFRLMGRERLSTQQGLARKFISLDYWVGKHCRDVLDESDEILDSRFQLVYSIGTQSLMDGQPDRWLITQDLLSLVAKQAYHLYSTTDLGLKLDYRDHAYPLITFVDPNAAKVLLESVVKEIEGGRLVGVSLRHCTYMVRQIAVKFIQQRNLTEEEFCTINREFKETDLWKRLHILRGLIAYSILLFAFQRKRWLVDYGLDLKRCLMAVPYRAKGVPAISAEFGHPDVAIVLTCLSYYYGGLTPEELRNSFDILMKDSDPASEYDRWARNCSGLPSHVRSLDGVNLDDDEQWNTTISPFLRFSKPAADFFLSRVVFPHEGKEFLSKLSTSAWDIPSQQQPNITTGFSGTNDNKFLLPASIKQHDLPQLHSTNAMVIDLLLRPENRMYIQAGDDHGNRLRVEGLLQLIGTQEKPIQVLIDVGAQVLEAANHDVAQQWLRHSAQAEAAVFFDESDDLMVVDREGYIERLFSSPFNYRMDRCLVYLDEVHTRGVDLGLPTLARAAVTLGPRITKDRLVQACMRMRKLGCHQSLAFFAPPEVHQEILEVAQKRGGDELDSVDVVRWCLEQTCRATDNMRPLWVMQGLEFAHRKRLCEEFLEDDDEGAQADREDLCDFYAAIQEPEGRPLEDMYGATAGENVFRPCLVDAEARKDKMVGSLLSTWDSVKAQGSKDWSLQEEQEREIAHEVEQERELQRPPPAKPLQHVLDPKVVRFVDTGDAASFGTPPFRRAFESLKGSSAYHHLQIRDFSQQVFVTTDFTRTVELTKGSLSDEFLRPVKWILSSRSAKHLLIISPFEANALLSAIRASNKVALHVYSAKTSTKMRSFSDLKFYVTPSKSLDFTLNTMSGCQLGLFAGCLFFDDYSAYKTICDFLGILTSQNVDGLSVRVRSDGFVDEKGRKQLDWPIASPFVRSPLPFFRALTAMRRKGYLYSHTHLGQLFDGRILPREAFL